MKCPKCGRENVPGAPFCADCGKALFSDDVPVASEAQSQPLDPVPAQAAQVTIEDVEPERAGAAVSAPVEDAVPTPIITDGAIHIGPVTDVDPKPIAEPEPEPESESLIGSVSVMEAEVVTASAAEAADDAVSVTASESVPVVEEAESVAAEMPAAVEAASQSQTGSASQPEVDPTPNPVPAGKFEGAFANPPEAETQMVADEVAQHEAEAAQQATDAQKAQADAPMAAAAEPVAAVEEAQAAAAAPAVAEVAETGKEPDAAEASASAPPEADAVPAAAPEPTPVPQFAPFAADAPIVPPNPARAHQTYAGPGGEVLYKKGCLAAAWDDITGSKNWFGKILLLGLVYCVPILNFYVLGYAMRWSRELFLGKIASMPERIFGNRMFVNGFFAFVVQLVISIIVGVCGFILEFIPLIGALCYIALAVLVSAFEYLAIMRVAVADRLGAGFDISQIWNTGKRNFGALCCATIVPSLIVGAIMVVIVMAIALIMCIPLMGPIAEAASAGYGYHSDAYLISQFFGVLLIMLPMLLVTYVICSFGSAFLTLLVMRATGHYVARYAQGWKQEQAVMSTAHINGV